MKSVVERFLSYVQVDTESVEGMECFPSTEKQKVLGNMLVEELKQIGASNVSMDEYGYVCAEIPATTEKTVKTIGFISHMDTAPAFTGANVKPRIVKNYDGSDIVLNESLEIVLSSKESQELNHYEGKDLIEPTITTTNLSTNNLEKEYQENVDLFLQEKLSLYDEESILVNTALWVLSGSIFGFIWQYLVINSVNKFDKVKNKTLHFILGIFIFLIIHKPIQLQFHKLDNMVLLKILYLQIYGFVLNLMYTP